MSNDSITSSRISKKFMWYILLRNTDKDLAISLSV
jgi:hypothetical protein